jgi:GNAT superfamily N-acetyltransferase
LLGKRRHGGGRPPPDQERIARDPRYHFEHIRRKKLEKYAEDFSVVYNKAWASHQGVKPIKLPQAMNIMRKLKPVLDENIVWFAYYDKEPVGFFIMLPELNQWFKHVNGKMNWWGKLKFAWHRWRRTSRKIFGVAFGVVPEHQRRGVEGAMVVAVGEHIHPLERYDTFEMNWIGDFNPKMMHIAESVGGKVIKTHITYRKLFDESKPFKRAPVMK